MDKDKHILITKSHRNILEYFSIPFNGILCEKSRCKDSTACDGNSGECASCGEADNVPFCEKAIDICL